MLKLKIFSIILILISLSFSFPIEIPIKQFQWLYYMMDKYHENFDVYTDVGSGGNHFPVRAKMWGSAWGLDSSKNIEMDEYYEEEPQVNNESITCIKCNFKSSLLIDNWGGFYFMNGIFDETKKEPKENWGDYPNAGYNLEGATQVSFYARGEKGGERVEFFVGGIGWSVDLFGRSIRPNKVYSESLPKISTGYITLSKDWKKYVIDVSNKDLKYVLSGFGWVTSAKVNGGRNITFYIDDIKWDKKRLDELRLITSYEIMPSNEKQFGIVMRNVAFVYDNALTLLAFLSKGEEDDLRRAKILADSLVYALENDRYFNDGRLRNAYMSGDLMTPPGWRINGKYNTVRIPGYWSRKDNKWYEDEFCVSTHTGNMAWAMIALISAYEHLRDKKYLLAVEKLGEWIEKNTKDSKGYGGFTGGYEGWEGSQRKLTYKSTEHNIDLYVAFWRLYEKTGKIKWRDLALHAKKFVEGMWDEKEGRFFTGTKEDGITINKNVIPLDVQAWSILAFPQEKKYQRALKYVEENFKVKGGFDFNTDRDGIWYEGTAFMACAYNLIKEDKKAQNLIKLIENSQLESGAIPASSIDGLTTGFNWKYFYCGHIGATSWYIFAKLKINPYWV